MKQFEQLSKKLYASFLMLLCIAIRPSEVQSVSIEIENLEAVVNSALERLINEIDPNTLLERQKGFFVVVKIELGDALLVV